MKLLKLGARPVVAWALVCSTAVAPMARAEDLALSAVGHIDLLPFAVIMIPVDAEDVAPFVPAGFELVDVNGKTSLFVDVGLFENTSFEFDNGSSLQDPAQFSYAELFVPTYGPEGSSDSGLVGLWRLASAPILPVALARLGVGCGGSELPRTTACHVPQLNVVTHTSPTQTTVEASVPWGYSPYAVSASFVPTSLPCAACIPPIPAWHLGSRGLMREDIVWGSYPDTAIVGMGFGTIEVAHSESPLSDMLGDPEEGEATGPAILLRAPNAQGIFALQ